MIFQIITHFPERYKSYLETGLPAKSYAKGLFQIHTVQVRDFASERRKGRVDESPYGGGPGMVLQVAPIDRALRSLPEKLPVVLFTPRGSKLDQSQVRRFVSQSRGYTLVSGYFEGVDERVAGNLVDYQVSLGDFVLGSGDLPALCFIEALTRLLPGYVGTQESLREESMENGLLEYPQYTRPVVYRGWEVPKVLLSGNHGAISAWRQEESRKITQRRKDIQGVQENEQ